MIPKIYKNFLDDKSFNFQGGLNVSALEQYLFYKKVYYYERYICGIYLFGYCPNPQK